MDTPDSDGGTEVVIDATAADEGEIGTAVLTAVAAEEGTDPAALPPLHESIDPDLLNEFGDDGGEAQTAISFEYLDYLVVVTGGVIQLYERG